MLGSAPIGWDALDTVSASLALEQVGGLCHVRHKRPLRWTGLLQLDFDLVVGRIDEVGVKELFSEQLRVIPTLARLNLDQTPNDIKDAPTKTRGRRDGRIGYG